MIFLVTYLSDTYKVKGYLALPPDLTIQKTQLQKLLFNHYGSNELPVATISEYLRQTPSHLNQVTDKKYPVLIYCRGGMGRFGRVRTTWMERFAQQGYIVFAPTYRGNEGGEGKDQFGGDEQEDVIAAYRLLQSFPFVNGEKISVMGFSRGAINAVRMAPLHPYRLILWSGVSDLAQTYAERPDLRRMLRQVLSGTPSSSPEAYTKRSPVKLAYQIKCPTLIIHGTLDEQVHISHGVNMYETLQTLGGKADIHTYEGYGHLFPNTVHEMATNRMFSWIEADH